MSTNNGYWVKWLVGILTTLIITALTMMGNNVIANDKDSRERDDCIEIKLNSCIVDQTKVNTEILIALAEIKTDVGYIKKAVK